MDTIDTSPDDEPSTIGMSDTELIAVTDEHIRNSMAYMGGRLAEMRRRNMYYYLGEAQGDLAAPEVEGRSAVVSSDVADTVEWMLPSLVKTFVAGDQVVEFQARRQQDEAAAQQATEFCNYVLHKQNPGFAIIYTWIKDALLQKAGVLKVWWDDSTEDTREPYRGITEQQAAMLLAQPEVEALEHSSYPGPLAQQQLQQMAAQAAAAGQELAQMPSVPMLHDLVVRRRKPRGQVRIENVPPEEFLIDRKAKSIASARFTAHRYELSISDLRARDYDNVDDIGSDALDNAGSMNAERLERRNFDDEFGWGHGDLTTPADESQRIVWVTECYIRVDANGDGIAEMLQVVRCGGTILRVREVDAPPFVSITPIILPHRFFGLCPADQAVESQKLKTSLLRASLDGLYHSVNGRTYAVDNQVNLDDLLTSRPGGVVRVKQQGAVGPLMEGKPDLAAAQSMLEYAEVQKENRTGFTRYSQGTNADALNQTATGINVITNRSDSRIELIARVLAETGFQDLFRRILQLVSQYMDQATIARVNGKWVTFDPRAWATQFDFSTACGLGTNNKDQQVAHLMQLAQLQGQAKQGGIPVQPKHIFATVSKLCEALGFKQPELFFPNPEQTPAQPPAPDPKLVEAQNRHQVEMLRLQIEREKAQADIALARERLEAEIALKREQFVLQTRADQESALYQALYAQSERLVDGPGAQPGNAGPAVAAGGLPGPAGPGGDGQPAVPGGLQQPSGAVAPGMGIQPGPGY
jgi:hypothetical protein